MKSSIRRTVRFWLNTLAVACILPAVLVAVYLMARDYARQRAGVERGMIATNVATGLAGIRKRLALIGGDIEIKTSSETGMTIFALVRLRQERLIA
jgi:hypothetical protein